MTLRYRRTTDIRVAEVAGDGVVLHLGSRRYFTVTESGLAILQAMDAPRTFDELVAVLTERYDVTVSDAATSVTAFLDHCRSVNLIAEETA
jgi:hypothetical protein